MSEQLLWWLFWGSTGLIFYTYAGYPLVVLLLSRLFRPLRRRGDYEPTVTVLIAAYNEEASIAKKVKETLALDYPPEKLDVVVVSDASADRTDEVLAEIRDPRLQAFRVERGGKTAAQNYGVRQATGEIILFSDATSVYAPDAVRQLVAYFSDERIGGVSGICRFDDGRRGGSPTGLGQVMYGGYEQMIRICQSRIFTATACSGPIYALRRKNYVHLPPHACSDMVEPIEVVRSGFRVVYAPEALAWEDTTRSVQAEFKMRVRVTTQGMQGLILAKALLTGAAGPWVAFQLISHKLLRYALPAPLAVLLLSSAALAFSHPLAAAAFGAQALFYLLALIGYFVPVERRSRVLSLPVYYCAGNAAVVRSLLEIVRGNQFAVWETVRK